ncbi:hypothetical protein C2857_005171 [Epichloe festucae Fl1]|uniref:Uncharacterized protein n=1 Tax=Epichloe festucae (strain Fl1) TaxID=877507 RepID=A0A7S9KSX7_EPIFF|nr:hypothetical protein C2857_005171 [Epichloe festucae Fl1]
MGKDLYHGRHSRGRLQMLAEMRRAGSGMSAFGPMRMRPSERPAFEQLVDIGMCSQAKQMLNVDQDAGQGLV